MSDIILEIIRSIIVGVIFLYLLLTGRREEIRKQNGWAFILAGFAFLLFGMIIDITDNFPGLNKYIVIGDTEYQAFIEKVIGYLCGFLLLAIGFWKWLPTVIALRKTERALKESHDELELRVRERTEELVVLNDQLQLKVAEHKEAEETIRESLKEKEVFMREIYHRVKNNMTVVSSLLRLQSTKVKDEHYKAMFNESVSRIKAMASIHEKLYQSEDVSRILFSDYIKDMVGNIYQSYGRSYRIRLITDIEDITLGIDASVPCGLIVNELITNSMKYAFPATADRPEGKEGEIKLSIRTNDKSEIELTFGDNGVGLPEGLDFRNTDSLGLTLVNALVGQLQGEIELLREKGTVFVITFKG